MNKKSWIELAVQLFPIIIEAIHFAELSGKSGKDKQNYVLTRALKQCNFAGINPNVTGSDDFQDLIKKFIDDYVEIQNFIALYDDKRR